jgi:hypothetical protein
MSAKHSSGHKGAKVGSAKAAAAKPPDASAETPVLRMEDPDLNEFSYALGALRPLTQDEGRPKPGSWGNYVPSGGGLRFVDVNGTLTDKHLKAAVVQASIDLTTVEQRAAARAMALRVIDEVLGAAGHAPAAVPRTK